MDAENQDESTISPNPPASPAKSPDADASPVKAILLSIAAAAGGFLFGFDSSVINGAVDAIQEDFDLSSGLTGFAVAVALLGCAVGAWYAGTLADKWGRVRVMLLGAALFFCSSIGAAAAFAVWDLVLWRLIGGLGIGIASVIAPTYIAEIAPARLRGRLGSLQQLAITCGIFTALLSDAAFAGAADGANQAFWFGWEAWRWMFLVGVIPSVVYGVLALQIPESPRFLIAVGKTKEARKILEEVTGPVKLDERVEEIQQDISLETQHAEKASLRGPKVGLQPVVWIGIALSALQQLVGINVIFYYSTTLWQAVGFSESDSFLVSVITSITNVIVTLVAIALVDKIGRRPLLLAGSIGMTVSLTLMTVAFSQATVIAGADGALSPHLEGAWGTIALVAANIFVVSFGASWGPVVWVLLGEMFPGRIRAKALAVAAAAQWIANFLVTVTFPLMSQDVSLTLTYGIYAVFAALSFFFVFAKIPETKGVELEEMENLHAERSRKSAERGHKSKS